MGAVCGCFPSKKMKADKEPLLGHISESGLDSAKRLVTWLNTEASGGEPQITEERIQDLCVLAYSDQIDHKEAAAVSFVELCQRMTQPVPEMMLPPIIKLLQSPEYEVAIKSEYILILTIGVGTGGIFWVISNFINFTYSILHQSSLVLCKVISTIASCPYHSISHQLFLIISQVQKPASLALTHLATRGPAQNKIMVVQSGALSALISLLESPHDDIRCNASGCITTLATLDTTKRQIAVQGAIPPLITLIRNTDINKHAILRNATGALLNLSHIEINRL